LDQSRRARPSHLRRRTASNASPHLLHAYIIGRGSRTQYSCRRTHSHPPRPTLAPGHIIFTRIHGTHRPRVCACVFVYRARFSRLLINIRTSPPPSCHPFIYTYSVCVCVCVFHFFSLVFRLAAVRSGGRARSNRICVASWPPPHNNNMIISRHDNIICNYIAGKLYRSRQLYRLCVCAICVHRRVYTRRETEKNTRLYIRYFNNAPHTYAVNSIDNLAPDLYALQRALGRRKKVTWSFLRLLKSASIVRLPAYV